MQYSKSNIGTWEKTAPSGAAFPSFCVNAMPVEFMSLS